MTALPPLIPDNAPFNPAQRAWLNGFFAGLLNLDQMGSGAGVGPALAAGAAAMAGMAKETMPAGASGGQDEEFEAPWHDPALELPERMDLAKGKPLPQRLMAAMGQLDCGQCGYDCKAYALKLADGSEPKQNLCVPGGRATQKKVKELLGERGSADQVAAEAAVSGQPSGVVGTNGHATPTKASSGISGTAVAAAAAVTAVAAGAVAAVAGIGRANPVTAMLKGGSRPQLARQRQGHPPRRHRPGGHRHQLQARRQPGRDPGERPRAGRGHHPGPGRRARGRGRRRQRAQPDAAG
jgi:hypothetical protein